jgi:hypothetical protein
MAQIDDQLLVAYSNGSFVLDGIDLNTQNHLGPIKIIPEGINPERSTLLYSEDLEMLICVFNHDQAASCGIAWASKENIFDPEMWEVQYSIVGPVYKDFIDIGLWEPYIAYYNSTTFLLYFSNQTLFDPVNPIDSEGYSFTLGEYEVVQKVEIYWVTWNGTGFETSYCGAASYDLPGGPIFYKDGMASSVLVADGGAWKEYIMTFEAFEPPKKIPRVTMVKLNISDAGVHTEWRREITDELGGAPFITYQNNVYVTSHRHHYDNGGTNIGFMGMKQDQQTYSKPMYLTNNLFGWPSVFTDHDDNLWLAGEDETTGIVTLLNLTLYYIWE